jgi:hypothetical protein
MSVAIRTCGQQPATAVACAGRYRAAPFMPSPAGIEDAAVNEGSELMSALVIEFVPVTDDATPTT